MAELSVTCLQNNFLDFFTNWLPAGVNAEPRSNFLLNVFQRKQNLFGDMERFSKILINFSL